MLLTWVSCLLWTMDPLLIELILIEVAYVYRILSNENMIQVVKLVVRDRARLFRSLDAVRELPLVSLLSLTRD